MIFCFVFHVVSAGGEFLHPTFTALSLCLALALPKACAKMLLTSSCFLTSFDETNKGIRTGQFIALWSVNNGQGTFLMLHFADYFVLESCERFVCI